MKIHFVFLSLVTIGSLLACNHRTTPTAPANVTTEEVPAPSGAPDTTLIQGNNQFALELYSYIRSDDQNVFFSPYSISAALAMTYAGARGESEKQMSKVLHFEADQKNFHPKYHGLLQYIEGLNQGENLELSTANAMFAQKEYIFLDSYFDLVKSNYGAGLQMLDFKNELEKSRLTINEWVATRTKNRIQNLIVEGMINEMARLVLVNAIYFNATWDVSFDEKETVKKMFYVTPETPVEAPFMHKEGAFKYLKGEQIQIAEIPYADSTLSMLVLLPDDAASMVKLEQELSFARYQAWIAQLLPTKINLLLPRFKTTSEFELSDVLKKMGMPHPFSLSADLSGMTGKKDLMIDKVIHKAFVDVNEKGTEAAAATAVIIRVKSAPVIPQFNVNRPFIFIIKENAHQNILFMGKINNPVK